MFLLLFVLFLRILSSYESTINKSFFQNKYNIVLQRSEVVWTQKSLIKNFEIKTFKFNRTATAINAKIKFNVDVNQFQVNVLGLKLGINEYKRTVIDFNINVCKALNDNAFGLNVLKTIGNVTNCPIKKGFYVVCNWQPDESAFPPGVPAADWKFQLKYQINGFNAMTANVYLLIKCKKICFNQNINGDIFVTNKCTIANQNRHEPWHFFLQ